MDWSHVLRVISISGTAALVFVDGELWREALRHSDISLEKAARWMNLDPRQLDRQLKGEEGHVLKYNGRTGTNHLPYVAHQWHALLKFARLRGPRQVRSLAIAELAAMGVRRQARMIRMNQPAQRERESA